MIKYLLSSFIIAIMLISCSKDDSSIKEQNKLDNSSNLKIEFTSGDIQSILNANQTSSNEFELKLFTDGFTFEESNSQKKITNGKGHILSMTLKSGSVEKLSAGDYILSAEDISSCTCFDASLNYYDMSATSDKDAKSFYSFDTGDINVCITKACYKIKAHLNTEEGQLVIANYNGELK
jgi:hypothetical protein